jgi:hypothetical protein
VEDQLRPGSLLIARGPVACRVFVAAERGADRCAGRTGLAAVARAVAFLGAGGTATAARRRAVRPAPIRASNTGVIMVAGQKIAFGRIHTGRVITVHVATGTMTIDLGGDDTRTIRRTTTQAVPCIKAHRPARSPMFPRASVKHVLGLIRQSVRWD